MDQIFYKKVRYYRAERQQAASTAAVGGRQNRPDYYGEHIKSVSQYKDWLKRQRKVVVLLQANGDIKQAQQIKPWGKWLSTQTNKPTTA